MFISHHPDRLGYLAGLVDCVLHVRRAQHTSYRLNSSELLSAKITSFFFYTQHNLDKTSMCCHYRTRLLVLL